VIKLTVSKCDHRRQLRYWKGPFELCPDAVKGYLSLMSLIG
jgi:hypothetical protein